MTIVFNDQHDKPKDCQLIVCLTGSADQIRDKLLDMADECVTKYGKPIQGMIAGTGIESTVITPVWKGKKY